MTVSASDVAAVERELGRPPRGVVDVAHRCGCGLPDVVTTAPRLPDGSPFPTLFYLTCPRAASADRAARGVRADARDDRAARGRSRQLAAAYDGRPRSTTSAAATPSSVLPGAVSAGGMPTRVKCLHVLVAHSLAAGPGVNPLGDEALALLPDWSAAGPCV